VHAERGEYDQAVALARDGASRAMAIGATMCVIAGNMFAGLNELARDRPDDAVAPLQLSYDLAGQNDAAWWRNISEAGLSSTHCADGDLDAARSGWAKTLASAVADHDFGTEALIRAQRAQHLAAGPDPDWPEIIEDLERAADLQQAIGARPREARARLELAGALERVGRTADAAAARQRSQDLFHDMGLASPTR
jgi:hypothetical protein